MALREPNLIYPVHSLLVIEDRLSVTTTINHLWGSINGQSWYKKLLDRWNHQQILTVSVRPRREKEAVIHFFSLEMR